jgi:hypothetical protein
MVFGANVFDGVFCDRQGRRANHSISLFLACKIHIARVIKAALATIANHPPSSINCVLYRERMRLKSAFAAQSRERQYITHVVAVAAGQSGQGRRERKGVEKNLD